MFSGVLGELESEEVAGNILTCVPDTGDGGTFTSTVLPKFKKSNPWFILDQRRECFMICLELKAIKDSSRPYKITEYINI